MWVFHIPSSLCVAGHRLSHAGDTPSSYAVTIFIPNNCLGIIMINIILQLLLF